MQQLTEEMKAILQRCVLSTGTFAKTLFPENFTRPFISLHQEIFKLIDDPKLQRGRDA